MAENDGAEGIIESLGLSPRSVRAWRRGERATVQFATVDKALTAMGLALWEVWGSDVLDGLVPA
jgi:hypothetical protein